MRSSLVKGVLTTTLGMGLVVGVIAARPAVAQDNLPEGPGKAETVAACGGCHGVGQIVGEHRDAAAWATTVTTMINNGAPVADADFDKIVAYLAANFGTGPAPAALAPAPAAPAGPPPPAAAAGAAAANGLPDGPGAAEVAAACGGCHGVGQLTGEHRDAATWATTVTSMINNGAPVKDADFDKIVAYLAAHYGP